MADQQQAKIELLDVLNPSESRFEYLGEDTIVSRVGAALFFFSLSTHKQLDALRFPAGYSLDAWTLSNRTPAGQGESQIVVALSGPDTRVHVYSWPRLNLEQSFLAESEVCFSRLAVSRCGRYLVGLSSEGNVQLRFWDLHAPDIDIQINGDGVDQTNGLLREREARLTLQEEMTFLAFNPFNHSQVVVGNERSVTIVTITAATSFQLATLTPQQVSIDANNLNSRRVLSVTWLSERQLLLSTKSGEILSCTVQPPPSVLAMREREIALQQGAQGGGADTPGLERSPSVDLGAAHHASAGPPAEIELGLTHLTDSDLALLGLVDPKAPTHLHTDWKAAEAKGWASHHLSVTAWCGHLPPAPEREDDDDEEKTEDVDPAVSKSRRGGVNPLGASSAIGNCMALTRHELVVGTSDGCLLWLNKHTQAVTHQQHIDVSGEDAGILSIAFSPSYATFVALTRRGHLRLFKPMSDRAAPSALDDGPTFQNSSLGHFPVASALTPMAPLISGATTLPKSLLATRSPVRVGHVLVPTHPSDLHPKNFKLVSYTSRGMMQLWCYGARQLLGTYQFASGITSAAVSVDGRLALIGLETGVVNIVDISNPSYMRLVFSHRFHNGPVLAIEFNKDGDLFATLGPKKVFFVRTGDFRVLGYTKLPDWADRPEPTTEDEKARLESTLSGLNAPLLRVQQSAEAEAQETAASVIDLDQLKHDDEAEVALDDANDDPIASAVPFARDTLVTMCWSTPVDREKLPNDRLLVSTREGLLIVLTAPNIYHDASELKLEPSFLQAVTTKLESPLLALTANLSDRTIVYGASASKLLQIYSLQYDSTMKLTKSLNGEVQREDGQEIGADDMLHQRPATIITQALTGNLLVTSGLDGMLVLRDGENLEYLMRLPVHDYVVGGSCSIGISPDSTLLTSSGFDGSLVVFDLAGLAPIIASRRTRKLKGLVQVIQPKVLEQLNEVEESTGEADVSYLATHHRSAAATLKEHDLQQKILKDELQKSLHTFKLQFNEILQRNSALPELERLGFNDFAIDLELKAFLTREGEKRIAAIREQIHSECVGKEYIIERIRQQCWNAMEVKGQMFTAFRSDLEVHNYPIRALAPQEARRIRQVQFLRRMEIVEKRWRHNQALKADENEVTDRNFHPQKFTEDSNSYLMNMELEKSEEPQQGKDAKEKPAGGKDSTSTQRPGAKKDTAVTTAGKAAISADMPLENMPRFLLYHPLDVITPLKKRTQSFLLHLKIEHLKKQFNVIFSEYYQVKQREIDHIHEKAKRIQEIQNELQMDVPVYKPVLAPEEIAHSVLSVDDSEIKSVKVLSKAERVLADAKAERERMSSETQDDGPERALDVMMGGTLVRQANLSTMEQEIRPEEWMKQLTPEQMTEEQRAELVKFEKKVALIQAEQETRRKLLQTELSKLKADVSEIAKTFDSKFKTHLAEHRIGVQRELYQHELMIIKMLNDMLVEEEKAKEEKAVGKKMKMLQAATHVSRALRSEFERTLRSSQSQYESMQVELKNQDRQFRKDLQNGGISVEQQQALAAEAAAANAAAQQLAAEQAAQIAAGGGELVDEDGNPLIVAPVIAPTLVGAGESLDALYRLFRSRKQSKTTKKSKAAPKMQIDAITGRAVRAGSGLGRLGLLGTLNATATAAELGSPTRSSSREGGTAAGSGAAALRGKRKKDGADEEVGDGTMNPYQSDLLAQLAALHTNPAHSFASGPNPQLLEDVKYLDLDDRDKPDTVDIDLWYALLERRQDFIEKERDVRRYNYKLQEMQSHLGHLHEMELALDHELRGLTNYQANLIEARTIFSLNTEVMLRIQQGQVEIEESPVVTDLKDCEMIDRVQVEKLNTVIKRQGSEKVDILKDTTVSRTAINLLEWTSKKLQLEHADSVDLTTELQLLRVTKSLQGLIKMGGHDNQKAAELSALDRKIEFVSAANRDSLLGKKLQLMKVKKRIKQQNRENERLYETVQELEAAVKERMQISSIRDEGRLEESRAGKERMKSLVTRRKLVDLAKLQSEEISFLRSQVENLRRRTFASFAIPQLPPNPDERAKSSYAPTRPAGARAAASGGLGAHYADPRPHTTLPGIGRDAAASGRAAVTLPPVRGGSAGTR